MKKSKQHKGSSSFDDLPFDDPDSTSDYKNDEDEQEHASTEIETTTRSRKRIKTRRNSEASSDVAPDELAYLNKRRRSTHESHGSESDASVTSSIGRRRNIAIGYRSSGDESRSPLVDIDNDKFAFVESIEQRKTISESKAKIGRMKEHRIAEPRRRSTRSASSHSGGMPPLPWEPSRPQRRKPQIHVDIDANTDREHWTRPNRVFGDIDDGTDDENDKDTRSMQARRPLSRPGLRNRNNINYAAEKHPYGYTISEDSNDRVIAPRSNRIRRSTNSEPSDTARAEKSSNTSPESTSMYHTRSRAAAAATAVTPTGSKSALAKASESPNHSDCSTNNHYNLRTRPQRVSYNIPTAPRSPPQAYKTYIKEYNELRRVAEENDILSDIDEASVGPNNAKMPGDNAAVASADDGFELVLPMNISELDIERCRKAGVPPEALKLCAAPHRTTVRDRISFDDVGGFDGHIKSLKEMVVLPLLYPHIYSGFGIKPPRGVLFHGPPGTGKTLMARALSQSCNNGENTIAFFMKRGADCLSKWIGEAEQKLRMLFEQAKAFQPSIIFFDELDGLAPVRSARQDQVHTSIVATLLALMDGIDDRGNVVVIGATNRPDSIDPALRRPGRFDRELMFKLPGPDARRRILEIHTKRWPSPLSSRLTDIVVARTKGWGGADIAALCTETVLAAVRRCCPQIYESSTKLPVDHAGINVKKEDFEVALNAIVPSTRRDSGSASGTRPAPTEIAPLISNYISHTEQLLFSGLGISPQTPAIFSHELQLHGSGLLSSIQSALSKSRVAVFGPSGMHVHTVCSAAANALEEHEIPVFSLDPRMIFNSLDVAPCSYIARIFSEAQRKTPSLVYIPMAQALPELLDDSAVSLISQCIYRLSSADKVTVLVSVEYSTGDVGSVADNTLAWRKGVPAFVRSWFSGTVESESQVFVHRVFKNKRRSFFAQVLDVAERIAYGESLDEPEDESDSEDCVPVRISDTKPHQPSQQQQQQQQHDRTMKVVEPDSENDAYKRRRLKHALSEVNLKATSHRLFKQFVQAPDPDSTPLYYSCIRAPISLSMITLKISAYKYMAVDEYLSDIRLIVRNTEQFARARQLAKSTRSNGIDASGEFSEDTSVRRVRLLERYTEKLIQKRVALNPELATKAGNQEDNNTTNATICEDPNEIPTANESLNITSQTAISDVVSDETVHSITPPDPQPVNGVNGLMKNATKKAIDLNNLHSSNSKPSFSLMKRGPKFDYSVLEPSSDASYRDASPEPHLTDGMTTDQDQTLVGPLNDIKASRNSFEKELVRLTKVYSVDIIMSIRVCLVAEIKRIASGSHKTHGVDVFKRLRSALSVWKSGVYVHTEGNIAEHEVNE